MRTLVFLAICMIAHSALAQDTDPAVLGYVGTPSPSVNTNSPEEGRYVRKPRPAHKMSEAPRAKRHLASEDEDATQHPVLQESTAPQVAPLPRLSGAETFNGENAAPTASVSKEEPAMGSRMRDILFGGDLETIDKYRSFLDSEDIRKNIFEFSASPFYMYNTSTSPYYYRNYINSGPGVFLGVDLWLTPFLGIGGDYRFTMLNEIKDSPTQENYVASSQTWFDIGLKFRRFFGMSVNSSSFTLGFRYADYDLALPPNATRLKQHMRAPEVDLDIVVPSSKTFMWNFGILIQPYVQSEERVASSDVRAGQSNQTVAFGGSLGGEYRFSRQTQAFFKLSTRLYKSQFAGAANGVDPTTGSIPSGISVNNVFYFFDFGFKIGR